MYTNLGEDGILHAMNETGCSVVVTSHDLMPKFEQLLDKLPHVTHLIYFEVGWSAERKGKERKLAGEIFLRSTDGATRY